MAEISKEFTASAKSKFTQDELDDAVNDAANSGRELLLRLALAAGGSPDGKPGRIKPLDHAIANVPYLADMLIDAGAKLDAPLDGDNYAVTVASLYNRLDIMQKIIDKKGNLNHQRKNGETALMIAAQEGHVAMFAKLLEAGADTSLSRSIRGRTERVLDIARRNAELESGPDTSFRQIYQILQEHLVMKSGAPKPAVQTRNM